MAAEAPRKIVLTGVSRGLGRAMAEGFIAAGHHVYGCARNADAVQALRARWSAPHDFKQVDIANDVQVAAWAAQVIKEFGPPDLLINNAAVINRNAPLWKISAEEFASLVNINVLGVANVIRHFVPAMVAQNQGVIVNFSSAWGRSTSPEVGPYCATKFAVEGMTKSLADELPNNMSAVPLNPGVINTDMLQSCFGSGAEGYPGPEAWARRAVPYILKLSRQDNGQSVSVPA